MGEQPRSAREPNLLALTEELRAIGELGAVLAEKAEDRERFQRVLGIAETLVSGDWTGPVRPPADVTEQWFHVSPLMSADCAAFDASGRMLLVKRNDNGLWALPGGLVEVGETPADAATREAWEEVGLQAEVVRLIGLYDSRSTGTDTPFQVVHLVYECRVTDADRLHVSEETDDFGWFSRDRVAPLSPGHEVRVRDAFMMRAGTLAQQSIC
ncbi:NUDIX hydrolase [Streptomyces roseoverticillatus]|uniref:NUDIX domain-containing protein n=1 Tax=Streptomyces roseoverticillatus TaxID=66429 RepID=A0ABV3IZ88_9ACTN